MIVLLHPDPTTNRNSAILVVQFSNGTATQEFTGGLAVLAFFPDCIAFSATTWEVPWPVRVHNRPPRYPGVSPDAGLPLLGTRTRSRAPPKRAFWGSNSVNRPSFFPRKLFFWRTTTADRPVAPWPHHEPEFSNFGSASPKRHFNAEPQ